MDNITQIDLSKVKDIGRYAGQYVVVSTSNDILASGRTYLEAARTVSNRNDVAIFSIPEADLGLAPANL